MALFGGKEPVQCAVCGVETGTKESRKSKISDGYLCPKCLHDWKESVFILKERNTEFDSLSIKRKIERMKEAEIEQAKFNESRAFGALHIDDKNQQWYVSQIMMVGLSARSTRGEMHGFDDIESSEIVEDGSTIETVKKGGLGRAVVGGALFGKTGAMVGAVTGKSKGTSQSVVNNVSVRVQLKGGIGSETIKLISSQVQASSDAYKNAIEQAKNIASAIESMINAVAVDTAPPALPENPDVHDEIRKYKALLDDGIITQDDFDAKKKQLLGI